MGINERDAFDSLNEEINLYKDSIEILEGILELYKSFFDLKDRNGENKHFLIDYGINIVEKYEYQWIELFDDILIYRKNEVKFEVEDIKAEDFDYIIYGMEKFFNREYRLFLNSWNLEVASFIEKNNRAKNIKVFIDEQNKETIQNFNLKSIKEIIELVRNEAKFEINQVIKRFNKSIGVEKDDLRYFINNKSTIENNVFYDELNLMRETVLRKVDELQSKVKIIIEEKLVKKSLEDINKLTEEKIFAMIKRYKEELNRRYTSILETKEKKITGRYTGKLITSESLHRRCGVILEVELNYLEFVKAVGVECFRILEKEAEAVVNNVFNWEFYSGIYDVKFLSDLENLFEIYKIKGDFILGSMVKGLLKEFIERYQGIINLMIKTRKSRVERLYVFKPITQMGNIFIYDPAIMVHLERYLIDIYDSYDLKQNKNKEMDKIKRAYIGLNDEIERAIEKFNYALKNITAAEGWSNSIQEEKVMLHKAVTLLKEELIKSLNSRFITVFNSFSAMVLRNIQSIENQIKANENNINYSDY